MLLGGTDWRGSWRKVNQWGDGREEERSPDSQLSVLPLLPLTPLSTRLSTWRMAAVKVGRRRPAGLEAQKGFQGTRSGPLGGTWGKTRDRQIEPHEIAISVDQK